MKKFDQSMISRPITIRTTNDFDSAYELVMCDV